MPLDDARLRADAGPAAGEPEGAARRSSTGAASTRATSSRSLDLLDPGRRARRARAQVRRRDRLARPRRHRTGTCVVRVIGVPDPRTLRRSTYGRLDRWLDGGRRARPASPPRAHLLAAAFSQGGVMSLRARPRSGAPGPAAIVALSGFVPTVEGWEPDFAAAPSCRSITPTATPTPSSSVEFVSAAPSCSRARWTSTYREHPRGHMHRPPAFGELAGRRRASAVRLDRSRRGSPRGAARSSASKPRSVGS